MKKTTKDIREESKKIFLEYVGENSNLRLLYTRTFVSHTIKFVFSYFFMPDCHGRSDG